MHSTIPDECKWGKAEDGMHWKDWEQGIDVTQTGNGPLTAMADIDCY
jgi:hypothetical protein